jgi:hypothetical protein
VLTLLFLRVLTHTHTHTQPPFWRIRHVFIITSAECTSGAFPVLPLL